MVVPSLKLTLPVGEAPPDSVAVKVTGWPAAGALAELDTAIEGAALPIVTAIAFDVAEALLLSPP